VSAILLGVALSREFIRGEGLVFDWGGGVLASCYRGSNVL